MRRIKERDLKKTAVELCEESQKRRRLVDQTGPNYYGQNQRFDSEKESLAPLVEERLVGATWTLRRMPDKERGFMHMRGTLWPDMLPEPGNYPAQDIGNLAARRRVRISPKEVDQMQPALDLLTLLPDILDRQILFWTAWHQDGEVQTRIPWAKVRLSLGVNTSRWTLKRRYEAGLLWLGALVALQR